MIVGNRWKKGVGLALVLAFVATPAIAATAIAVDVAKTADFGAKRAAIEQALADDETFAEITPEARSRAQALMSEMDALIGRTGSVDTLPPVQQVEVFNRQEELNQILAQAAGDSRLVCRRERPTGSKMPTNSCKTVAERRRVREGDKQFLMTLPKAEAKVEGR
ncbi:MAG TPA: hypothetical protein VFS82_05990 [Lysobacter sp.]|nr:hypothetical protein [Lysobacter sp.]